MTKVKSELTKEQLEKKIEETNGLIVKNSKIIIEYIYSRAGIEDKVLIKNLDLELTAKNIGVAKSKLALLIAVRPCKGITLHGNRIRMSFVYKGERCHENLNNAVTTANIKAANNKRIAIMHEIMMGSFDYVKHFPNSKKAHLRSDSPCANETVKEAADNWLEIKKAEVAPSSYRSYRSKVYCHIISKFGNKRLDSIIPSDIKKWISTDLYKLSNKSINNICIPFKGIFSDAVADGKLKYSPFKHIKQLKEKKNIPDPFTKEEIDAFINTPTNRVQEVNAFEFSCWTGLRPSELIAVAWEDIDTINWQLKVSRGKVESVIKKTKNDGSERTIDLIAPAIEAIKRQMEYSKLLPPQKITVLDTDKKSYFEENVRFVFLNSISNEAHSSTGNYRGRFFEGHIRKAGIRYRAPKQARHTFASQLLTMGINIKWIANQMGHTTIKMIEEHYGTFMNCERSDMADQVSSMLGYKTKRSNRDPAFLEKEINPLI
jgi:integrase